jgi:hypothetical protein
MWVHNKSKGILKLKIYYLFFVGETEILFRDCSADSDVNITYVKSILEGLVKQFYPDQHYVVQEDLDSYEDNWN